MSFLCCCCFKIPHIRRVAWYLSFSEKFFIYYAYMSFFVYRCYKYFFQLYLFCYFLNAIFWKAEVLSFIKSNLSDFTVIYFGILSRRHFSPCGHYISSLLLSSKHPSIPSLWWHFSVSVRAVSGYLVDRCCRRKGLCCWVSMVWGWGYLVPSHKHWLVSPCHLAAPHWLNDYFPMAS